MFSLSTHIFAFYRLTAKEVRTIADYGFKSVELWGALPHFDYKNRKYIQEMKILFENYGILLASVHSPFYLHLVDKKPEFFFSLSSCEEKNRNLAIDEILILLDAIENFPFKTPVPVVVHTGIGGSDTEDVLKCKWERLAESIEKLIKRVIGSPFILALENGSSGKDRPQDIAFFVSEYSSPYLRMCFDVGHANITDSDWLEILKEIKGMIVDYHIHDNMGKNDEHLPPGVGSIDFGNFFKIVGNDSLFTLELMDYSRGEDIKIALESLEKSIEFLGRRGLWTQYLEK